MDWFCRIVSGNPGENTPEHRGFRVEVFHNPDSGSLEDSVMNLPVATKFSTGLSLNTPSTKVIYQLPSVNLTYNNIYIYIYIYSYIRKKTV